MTIEFRCPDCDKLLRTSDDKAGARAKCPDCGTAVTVPKSESEEDFDFSAFDEDDPVAEDRFASTYSSAGGAAGTAAGVTPGMKNCPMCGAEIRQAAIKCRHCGEVLGTRPAAATSAYQPRQQHFHYAGFWLRFVAAFIDGIILSPVNIILMLALGVPILPDQAAQQPPNPGAEMLVNIISILVAWLYHSLLESSDKQGSLGKMALGIKVVDEQGRRISFGRATGRHFGKIISGCLCLVGYIMAGFTERKQALHDMMAGCLVVRK